MRYIIVPVNGCPLPDKDNIRECGHKEWTMNCDFYSRAVYFAKYNIEKKYEEPSGIPIMFLRGYGMNAHAQELIDLANRV